MDEKMKTLVLGAGGFIGGVLVKRLKEDGRFTDVIGQSRKYKLGLSNRSPVYILTEYKPDVIFNCSGHSTPIGDVDDMFFDNVSDLVHLLSNFKQANPPIFVHLSSIVVENSPLTVYAASKACSEIVVKSFGDLGIIKPIILRPCGVVGGNATHGMLHDVIRRLKDDPTKLDILSSKPGSQKPYIHVNDLVELMIDLVTDENKLENKPYSVCSQQALSVEGVINIILETLNVNPELNYKECPWVDQPFVRPISDFSMMPAAEAIKIASKEIWDKINV